MRGKHDSYMTHFVSKIKCKRQSARKEYEHLFFTTDGYGVIIKLLRIDMGN